MLDIAVLFKELGLLNWVIYIGIIISIVIGVTTNLEEVVFKAMGVTNEDKDCW